MKAETTNSPKTLVDAVRYFSDLDVAHAFFTKIRWADGVVKCPTCGCEQVKYLASYRRWECREKHSRRQFSVKVGTIMEDSPMGLDKWAVAFWLEVNAKNSISSYEIHRALGITQKSAWFMLHRIRLAVQSKSFEKIGGNGSVVEADETFVGGKRKNMHKSRRAKLAGTTGAAGMAAVMGLLERHTDKCSQVRATVIRDTKRETIHDVIHKNVESQTHLYTDAFLSYRTLDPSVYFHQFVDHVDSYVKGAIHTNGLENFWSLFKRCIKGTHVSVEPFHLGRYVDSEAFRFNNRDFNDGERFRLAIRGMVGKRITYKALTGALEVAPASDSDGASENLPN